jgi:molybdopterin-guanine dinucleotide biosynthesis protein A
LLGLILGGGKSRRFGSPKALARIGGLTFLERVYNSLREVADEVALSASESTPVEVLKIARKLGLIIVWDNPRLPCRGPPRGVASAYRELAPGSMLIAAVDYPFITSDALDSIVFYARSLRARALTPILDRGYPLVTLGYANSEALESLATACIIKPKTRLTDLYRVAGAVVTGWSFHTGDPRAFTNVNRPEDLAARPVKEELRDLIPVEGFYYENALRALSHGDKVEAKRYLLLEAREHGLRGLTLFQEHSLDDYKTI